MLVFLDYLQKIRGRETCFPDGTGGIKYILHCTAMRDKIRKILLLYPAVFFLCCAAPAFSQETPEALFQKAEALYKEKKHAEALPLYQKAVAADSTLSPAYRGVVLCYGALGNPQGALKYMDSLFLDRPDSAELEYGMGCALYSLQKYGDAAKYFDKAIKMKPDLAAAWNNRGSIYHFVARDYGKAREYYEKAVAVGTRTGAAAVVKIAKENLANLPREEDLKPMTLEDFLNAFVARAEESDAAGVRWLVQGQKPNCEPALDWLLEQALEADVQANAGAEKTTVALATLLAAEYSGLHKGDSLKKKLAAYTGLSAEKKKKLADGSRLLAGGIEQEEQASFEQAAQAYAGAAASYAAAGDTAKRGLALVYLGDAQRRLKQYPDARASYTEAEKAFMEVKDEKQRALALTSLGFTSALLKEHAQAIEFFNRALKIYTALKDEQSAQKVRENIARVEQMGKN